MKGEDSSLNYFLIFCTPFLIILDVDKDTLLVFICKQDYTYFPSYQQSQVSFCFDSVLILLMTEWYTFPLWPEQNIQFQVFYINLKILTKDTYNAAFPKDAFSLVESRGVCEPWKWECLLSHHFVSVPRLYWNVMAKLVIGKSTLNHRQTSHSWTIFSLNLEHTSIAVETDY